MFLCHNCFLFRVCCLLFVFNVLFLVGCSPLGSTVLIASSFFVCLFLGLFVCLLFGLLVFVCFISGWLFSLGIYSPAVLIIPSLSLSFIHWPENYVLLYSVLLYIMQYSSSRYKGADLESVLLHCYKLHFNKQQKAVKHWCALLCFAVQYNVLHFFALSLTLGLVPLNDDPLIGMEIKVCAMCIVYLYIFVFVVYLHCCVLQCDWRSACVWWPIDRTAGD